jgi:hypothetical protein
MWEAQLKRWQVGRLGSWKVARKGILPLLNKTEAIFGRGINPETFKPSNAFDNSTHSHSTADTYQ